MNPEPESGAWNQTGPSETETMPEMRSASFGTNEPGTLETYRFRDEAALAEVPSALQAYLDFQRFDLV